jgi:REP element-mobilizing transposase RayT
MSMGYFITWTCYGTWLHGDERSSVDDDHSRYLWPRVRPNAQLEAAVRHRLKGKPVTLDAEARAVAEQAIRDHCELRGWFIRALSVRSNHVHLVVLGVDAPPETIMKQCKDWATRRLRDAGLVPPQGRVWTAHGSTQYLFTVESVADAADYVLNRQ